MSKVTTAVSLAVFSAILWSPLNVASIHAQTVKIGMASNEDRKADFQPLVDHLNASSGFHVDFTFFTTVDELYEAFRLKQVRLALFGSVFYAKAHHEIGVVPIVKDKPNSSVLFVRNNSTIQKVEDLRGKRMAFGYPESTTSSLIPRLALWDALGRNTLTGDVGVFNQSKNMVLFHYAGSHDAVIESVMARTSDCGATVDALFDRNKGRGLRAIHTSDPYPGVALVCDRNEESSFIKKIRDAFLSYRAGDSTPDHQFKNDVSAATDKDYAAVRYLCAVVLGKHYDH